MDNFSCNTLVLRTLVWDYSCCAAVVSIRIWGLDHGSRAAIESPIRRARFHYSRRPIAKAVWWLWFYYGCCITAETVRWCGFNYSCGTTSKSIRRLTFNNSRWAAISMGWSRFHNCGAASIAHVLPNNEIKGINSLQKCETKSQLD